MKSESTSFFESLTATPRSHFQTHFYAAVYRVLHYLYYLSGFGGGSLDALLRKYPFLASYLQEIVQVMPEEVGWDEGIAWWADGIQGWEAGCAEHLPLRTLAEKLGLPWQGRLAFMLVGLVEEDSRFGTLFAELQAPIPHRRACMELVGQMLMEEGTDLDPWRICRPLVKKQLVEVMNGEAPRSEWILRMPEVLWDAARGEIDRHPAAWCTCFERSGFEDVGRLIFPESFLRRVEQVPDLIASGKADGVVVRGTPGSDRLAILGSIARRGGRGIVLVKGEEMEAYGHLLGPLCTMTAAMPVVEYDLGPGETTEVAALSGYDGPAGFVLGFEGGLRGVPAERAVSLRLPTLKSNERERHWREALGDFPVQSLDEINERFHLPGRYIRQAAAAAIAEAALDGRQEITSEDARAACRTLNRQFLDTLAAHLEAGGGWYDLIVNKTAQEKLFELEQRCRHRERVLDHLGPAFGNGMNRGVRALFSGPSGTGKTLAARILAAELGMDLYRVDLAAVVNKYIGETEKNLHRVLSVAEELDVVLLLDEGDSLLGSRTNVKSANDRYANLETNYLLQRLEHYQGVVIVTTNLGENIDRAFQRRIDVSVEFLPPEAAERWHIWQLHLPERREIDDEFLQEVSVRCTMTGAQIRNAAMLATLLALDDGARPVFRRHVEAAVLSEYQKAGATCPLVRNDRFASASGGVAAFIGSMQ